MAVLISEEKGLAAAVLDALSSNICVIDKNGAIVAVNRAWQNFAIENPPVSCRTGVGMNYLDVCRNASGHGSEGADKFAEGVLSVLEEKTELFQMEYPCHAPTQNRWFLGRVTPLEVERGGAVISHATITDRKMLEFQLERLAATDSLTTLPNRRFFLETANLEFERVRRFGAVSSVAMIDIDHFKTINDTHGHAAGDKALRCISRTFNSNLRKTDILARIGGEEFVMLLPATDENSARIIAEKLRQAVYSTPIRNDENQFSLTASFGVSGIRAEDRSVDESIGRADVALYAAKRAGRNCVMSFAAIHADGQRRSG